MKYEDIFKIYPHKEGSVLPNEKGWYTKEEVLETGLPYYIPASKRWTDERYGYSILLTKSRCKEFGIGILSNGLEHPVAFRYGAAAGTGTSDKKSRYFPLYDRTSVFEKEISKSRLYEHEIMGGNPNARS